MKIEAWIFDNSSLKLKNMSTFHPLKVVDRGSDTQVQVGENYQFKCSALDVNVILN